MLIFARNTPWSPNIKQVKFKVNSLSQDLKSEASRLLPDKNYIGFSITQGNVYREKSWDIKNFINLANKLVEYNKIPVFFIEKDKKDLIEEIKSKVPKALFPESYSNLLCPALVSALATRLETAISIDNGIMHMLSLADIKMIVLFGPTSSQKFAPTGSNVTVLDSKQMYNSKDINKITVHDVFKQI